jgi:hypothetical protein
MWKILVRTKTLAFFNELECLRKDGLDWKLEEEEI